MEQDCCIYGVGTIIISVYLQRDGKRKSRLSKPAKRRKITVSVCTTAPTTNWRYLNTPQKLKRVANAKMMTRRLQMRIKRLQSRMESLGEAACTPPDNELYSSIRDIIEVHGPHMTHLPTDIKRIFWEQQVCMYILHNAHN